MSGFEHDIAGGQGNLIATSLQSPNFVAGSVGWQVRKDGSVEFNNGTFRGTVTAATIIGALIESAASGRRTTMDSNGDIKVFNASGAVLFWYNNSRNALFMYTDTGSATQGALLASVAGVAGTDPFGTAYPAGVGVEVGGLALYNQGSTPAAVTGASSLYSSGGGRLKFLSSTGVDAVLDRSTVNVAQFAMGTQTLPTIISAPLNYQANEGTQSSEFEIEMDGIITSPAGTAATYTLGLGVDGSVLGAQFTIGTAYLVVSSTFTYSIRFRLTILTSGAGGTCLVASDGSTTKQTGGPNQGNTNVTWSLGANSGGLTKSFDSTTGHTLQVLGSWSSTVGTGHGVVTYRTRITRRD